MQIKRIGCYIVIALSIAVTSLYGQRRFGAAVEAGLTASQLDGDLAAGYTKPGVMAGLRGIIYLKAKTHASIGFLFAQRGAQDELFQTEPRLYSITLNYLEVPILFHYADWKVTDDEGTAYYKAFLSGGISYGRLIGTRLKDDGSFAQVVVRPVNPPPGRSDYLNRHDISGTLGGTLFFNKQLGVSVRWMRSFNFVYNPKKWDSPPLKTGWNAHSLNFSLLYQIIK